MYSIIMRNSTVTFSHFIMRSNAKKARKAVMKNYAGEAGWSIYRMYRVG